jgi:hypothetical protein
LFGGRVFQQRVEIPMDTNCAPPLAFIGEEQNSCRGFLRKTKIRNIDDDLSLTSKCGENVDRI